MNRNYRYIRGSRHGQECVEFDVMKPNGEYITTCVVNAYRLIIGIRTHPCGDGDGIKLDDKTALEVLRLIQKERDVIKNSGKLKTLDGWRECGLDLDEYLVVGDEVDEELADEQLNCVPPYSMKSGYFQVGEPYNQEQDENGRWRSTWATFVANGPKWIYCGHCFSNDTINRVKERDRVEKAIQARAIDE